MRESYAKELQDKAAEWAAAHDALTSAKATEDRAKSERESAQARFQRLDEEMGKCVGANVTKRLFDLGDRRMVLVEHVCDSRARVSLIAPEPSE